MAIVNHKNISTSGFDQDALTTTTSGEQVLNFGDLTTTGDLANGVFAGADDVLVRNFGAIETSGDGAAGIFVQGDNARIENFGSVHTTGDFFGDFEFFSEGIFAEGDGFYIANHGSVQVEGFGSSVLVGDGADGLIVNFGVVNSLASNSSVVVAIGEGSQAINAGQVTSGGNFTGALEVTGEDASALNRGEILVAGAGSSGMGGDANTHLTNQGLISITADDSFGVFSFGMVGLDGGTQISNFGLIETHGTFAAGITALGRVPLGELGLDFDIMNAGHIATEGDLATGVTLGLGRFGLGNAANGQIVNSGVIETEGDGAAGVLMIGDGHHLTNSGRITSDGGEFFFNASLGPDFLVRAAGAAVSGDDALIENTRTGVIESQNADSAAVELNVLERDGLSNADTSSLLENFGLIKGANVAILGGVGQETVINHGTIVGDVDLGDGADTFVFGKGGALVGNLFLGGGHDLVRVENGSGTSRIADFAAGGPSGDVVDVSAFFSSFGDLEAHSQQSGNDVVITLDHNDHLVLAGVQLSALNAGDFLFDQLVQAMAGFGGASGATDGSNAFALGAEPSQQQFLVTSQHV
jgi:hypothetical protein